jgi:nucleotide-binding universal stress UspA family protein
MPEVRRHPLCLSVRAVTYRRVVVGTDGSDSADRALDHAAWLARALGAELLISHAWGGPQEPEDSRQVGSSVLRDACARVAEPPVPRPVLRRGDPANALIAVAGEERADLIVVGNRGLGGRRVLMGTVPARVAGRAPCDVLIAHTAHLDAPPGWARVLIGTDRSPTAERAAATGTALAEALGAEREVLEVTEDEPAAGLVRAASDRGADLIVIGNKGLVGARRFLTSVPSRVARAAPCHVLLVKTT